MLPSSDVKAWARALLTPAQRNHAPLVKNASSLHAYFIGSGKHGQAMPITIDELPVCSRTRLGKIVGLVVFLTLMFYSCAEKYDHAAEIKIEDVIIRVGLKHAHPYLTEYKKFLEIERNGKRERKEMGLRLRRLRLGSGHE